MPRPNADDLELKGNQKLMSLYRLWLRTASILGLVAPEFDELGASEQEAWALVLNEGERVLESAEGARWHFLAANLNLTFQRAQTEMPVGWDEISPATHLRWECLTRHLLNLMVFDTSEDGAVEDHEDRMAGWFKVKLQEAQLPESVALADREARQQRAESPSP